RQPKRSLPPSPACSFAAVSVQTGHFCSLWWEGAADPVNSLGPPPTHGTRCGPQVGEPASVGTSGSTGGVATLGTVLGFGGSCAAGRGVCAHVGDGFVPD